jgi:hypothetical protein
MRLALLIAAEAFAASWERIDAVPNTYETSPHSSTEDEPLPAFLARVRRMSSGGYVPAVVLADNLGLARAERRKENPEKRTQMRLRSDRVNERNFRGIRGGQVTGDLSQRRKFNWRVVK